MDELAVLKNQLEFAERQIKNRDESIERLLEGQKVLLNRNGTFYQDYKRYKHDYESIKEVLAQKEVQIYDLKKENETLSERIYLLRDALKETYEKSLKS